MVKLTNTLLIIILVVLAVVGIIVSQKDTDVSVNIPDAVFGYSGYNELGRYGVNQTSTSIGTVVGDEVSSTTAYRILSENSGRMYAEIWTSKEGTGNEVRIYFGTTTASSTLTQATTSHGATPDIDIWAIGRTLSSSTPYIIGPDNLWRGEVWALATSATTTVNYIEK